MKCPFCGILISDNTDFCENCGSFIPSQNDNESKSQGSKSQDSKAISDIKDKESAVDYNDPSRIINNLFSMQPTPSDYAVKEKSKNRRTANKFFPKKSSVIIAALVLIVIIALLIIPRIGVRRGIAGIKEPIQNEASGYVEKDIAGYEVSFYFQYSYEIEGLVIHTKNYYGFGLANRLAPRDIGLAWGDVAEYNDKIDFNWRQSGRWLYWKVKSYDELEPVGDESDVSMQSSNNHLIPADNSIKRKIKKIKKGDHIKIKGYLVNVDAENKKGKVFLWDTSTTRTDTGDGACEIIYVTDIIWLD